MAEKKCFDKDAKFIFVPADKVADEAKRLGAIPFNVKNVELGHHGQECSFEALRGGRVVIVSQLAMPRRRER